MGRALILAAAVALPAYWESLPTLATPGVEAIAADADLEGEVEAWGDPATGTYGIIQTVRSAKPIGAAARAIDDVHANVRAQLERDGAVIESFEVAPHGPVSESIARYTLDAVGGQTRAQVVIEADGRLRVQSASCFYTARERDSARRQCEGFLERWSPPS